MASSSSAHQNMSNIKPAPIDVSYLYRNIRPVVAPIDVSFTAPSEEERARFISSRPAPVNTNITAPVDPCPSNGGNKKSFICICCIETISADHEDVDYSPVHKDTIFFSPTQEASISELKPKCFLCGEAITPHRPVPSLPSSMVYHINPDTRDKYRMRYQAKMIDIYKNYINSLDYGICLSKNVPLYWGVANQ